MHANNREHQNISSDVRVPVRIKYLIKIHAADLYGYLPNCECVTNLQGRHESS